MFELFVLWYFILVATIFVGFGVGKVVDLYRANSHPRLLPERNPLTVDTEPTDEELRMVMVEARDEAVKRKLNADKEMASRIQEAVKTAKERAGIMRGQL